MADQSLYTQQCVTEEKEHKFNYSWKIVNWKSRKPLTSKEFVLPIKDFRLTFTVKTDITDLEFALLINFDRNNFDASISPNIKISVVDGEGNRIYYGCSVPTERYSYLFKSRINYKGKTIDTLTVLITISYVKHDSYESYPKPSNCLTNALNAYEQQLKKYPDFMLVAPCKKKLPTHKFILATHSPVFAALIETDMKEKEENLVEIPDISYEALEEMLCFMYNGQVNNLEKLNVEILLAAEKYQIDELKKLCLHYLADNLNVKNAVKIYLLSDSLNETRLQNKAIAYIKANASSFIKTEGFKSLSQEQIAQLIQN